MSDVPAAGAEDLGLGQDHANSKAFSSRRNMVTRAGTTGAGSNLERCDDDDDPGKDKDYNPQVDLGADHNDTSSDEREAGGGNDEDDDPNPKRVVSTRNKNAREKKPAKRSGGVSARPKRRKGTMATGKHRRYYKGIFPCSSCTKVYTDISSLYRHKKFHEPGSVQQSKCPKCSKMIQVTGLARHVKVMHGELELEGEFPCKECGKVFKTASRLESHIERIHTEGKGTNFCCASCPKSFKTKLGLRFHEKSYHEEPDLTLCPHCPNMYPRHSLYSHVRKMHGGKSNLKGKVTKSEKTLQCQYCPKTFTGINRNILLKKHEACHSTERKFTCPECPFAGKTKDHLYVHMSTHKEKVLTCQYCPKSFSCQKYLKCHERSHTKETPYKCDMCPKAFGLSSSLSNHRRITHGITKAKNLVPEFDA